MVCFLENIFSIPFKNYNIFYPYKRHVCNCIWSVLLKWTAGHFTDDDIFVYSYLPLPFICHFLILIINHLIDDRLPERVLLLFIYFLVSGYVLLLVSLSFRYIRIDDIFPVGLPFINRNLFLCNENLETLAIKIFW